MANYYIATNGNDNNSGDINHPWLHISKANSMVVAGDTVYFRAGTYYPSYDPNWPSECICPANSGTPGNYITYRPYQSEVVTISNTNYGALLQDKSYVKVEGLRFVDVSVRWIEMSGIYTCEHNIIQNCYFGDLVDDAWAGVWFGYWEYWGSGECNYNQLLNNEFHAHCHPQNIIQFNKNACYNLIEGNRFYGGPHEAIGFYAGDEIIGDIKYNVIRNNYVENQWHTGMNIYSHSERNLIENNTIVHCGHDHLQNLCGTDRDRLNPDWIAGAIQVGGPRNIIRRNTIIDSGAISINHYQITGPWAANSNQTYIFHNSFTLNHKCIYGTTSETLSDCQIKNNIFYMDTTAEESTPYEIQWDMQGADSHNYFIKNNILGAGLAFWPAGEATLAYLQAHYPSYWHDNTQNNPLFVNPAAYDLRLQSGSLCIDAGTWLTLTNGTGVNSTTMIVDDAGYFCSGWGIIPGDLIQLEGQTTRSRVLNVNYSTNTLTLETPLTWGNNVGVALAYNGTAPDQGAFEYTGEIIPDFSIVCPDSGMVEAGGYIEFSVIADSQSGFVGAVTFSASGGPPGTVITWPRGTVWNVGGQNPYPNLIVSLSVPANAPPGNYLITITGVSND